MRQQSLAMQSGFEKFGRKSKRELFLEEMDKLVPWAALVGLIGPHYPKGEHGRPPVGLERMLRLYFLQQWFNLSDPGLEDALYESQVLRLFAGIDLGREPVPDETTILNFRHLLEKHDLGRAMLNVVNEYLAQCGVRISTGTIVDATIIHAPSSTKNEAGKRDPEMHQTKKGNQWYFGMKAHVGVDSKQGIVHSAEATAANIADSKMGRRGVSGSGREDASQGSPRPGYDLAPGQIQADRQPVTAAEEPHQGAGAIQGRACLSRHEASVRIRPGQI